MAELKEEVEEETVADEASAIKWRSFVWEDLKERVTEYEANLEEDVPKETVKELLVLINGKIEDIEKIGGGEVEAGLEDELKEQAKKFVDRMADLCLTEQIKDDIKDLEAKAAKTLSESDLDDVD